MADRRSVLVTRPRADAERTAAGLAALGLDPIVAPMLEERFTGIPLPDASGFAAVALTSANGVRALAAHPQGEAFSTLRVYAVGEHTASEARAAGFENVSAAEGTLADLSRAIIADRPAGKIFYPAAHHQSGDLAGLLAEAGITVDMRVLYEMHAATMLPPGLAERLATGKIDGAVFYSRRTAAIFAGLIASRDYQALRRSLYCLCLSENVAQPLIENHFLRIGLADYPSHEAMMTLALAFARDQISP
ncbi:uroporphyrinogen-III synthase [Pelagibacterium flavum]|uniref:Uroporphyrinogen-III synthase n=1 Tax=Pelagibacterium flavum TaxID=2984530 RepID=A0ABY6IP64_9HYPH|nr:uroporphyrinogen-III synthase [Pelagibacterium sp. YIM 151497]UYQ72407.1 uroporphyrinogen-III synthase [Pelagibacterium sp. YIM 151497]|tara:strand:+ start:1528 stop:2271 length:744 start_codon:yes stop_codon:yes gene_type:complete